MNAYIKVATPPQAVSTTVFSEDFETGNSLTVGSTTLQRLAGVGRGGSYGLGKNTVNTSHNSIGTAVQFEPKAGRIFRGWVRIAYETAVGPNIVGLAIAYQGTANNGYQIVVDNRRSSFGASAAFHIRENASTTNILAAGSLPAGHPVVGAWYRLDVEWVPGLLTASLFTEDGTLLRTLTTDDVSYTSGGFGIYGYGEMYADDLQVIDTGVGSKEPIGSNIIEYTVTEDSTPLDGDDTSGGVGQIKLSFKEESGSRGAGTLGMYNMDVTLTDDKRGETTGKIVDLSGSSGVAKFQANSRLASLIADVTAEPQIGTLDEVIEYYLSLGGITSGWRVTPELLAQHPGTLAIPGFTGDLWTNMKNFAAAFRMEIALVSSNIVFRPVRTRKAQIVNVTDRSWSIESDDLARNIEIYNYNTVPLTAGSIVYPSRGGRGNDSIVVKVGSAETQVIDVKTENSIIAVNNPLAVDSVPFDYSGTSSVYSVTDREGLPVSAGEWVSKGGFVRVERIDSYTLRLVVGGMADEERAPFTIGSRIAGGDEFSTLRLTGIAVGVTKEIITIPTGADASVVTEVGASVNNNFVVSLGQALALGVSTAGKWGTPTRKLSISALNVLPANFSGDESYPTFHDFDTEYEGYTFLDFDTEWAGQTFADFEEFFREKYADDFETQQFGNIAGALVLHDDMWFRIRSTTISTASVSFDAEPSVTFEDVETAWSGKTFGDFDAEWAGYTFAQFALFPMHTNG